MDKAKAIVDGFFEKLAEVDRALEELLERARVAETSRTVPTTHRAVWRPHSAK